MQVVFIFYPFSEEAKKLISKEKTAKATQNQP
jgi:hypothetical protein